VRISSPGRRSSESGSEVDAGRGVLDEREISIRAADVTGEGRARLVEQAGQAAREEVDGFELELPLPGVVALEDELRARAERSVVEERNVGGRAGTRVVARLPRLRQ
jgi:hypothetical protein